MPFALGNFAPRQVSGVDVEQPVDEKRQLGAVFELFCGLDVP